MAYSLGPGRQHRYIAMPASSDRIAQLATMDYKEVYVTDESRQGGEQRVSTVRRVQRQPMQRVNPTLASEFFGAAFDAYWKRDHQKALRYCNAGLTASDRDARLWYYKAFAEIELGQKDAAAASLAEAVRVHLADRTRNRQINRALERIQGEARVQIQQARTQAETIRRTQSLSPTADALVRRGN